MLKLSYLDFKFRLNIYQQSLDKSWLFSMLFSCMFFGFGVLGLSGSTPTFENALFILAICIGVTTNGYLFGYHLLRLKLPPMLVTIAAVVSIFYILNQSPGLTTAILLGTAFTSSILLGHILERK